MFVKLTRFSSEDTFYINANMLVSISLTEYPGQKDTACTFVEHLHGDTDLKEGYYVKETPEEIIKMIYKHL